jgi:hypothetical protein
MSFFDQQPRVAAPARPVPVPHPMTDGYRFENVSFRYPGSATDVIEGLTLHLRPIVEAAQMSLAMPVIDELPRRFDQMLGRRFESGIG